MATREDEYDYLFKGELSALNDDVASKLTLTLATCKLFR